MKVLVVTHYYPEHCGGIEIVASELASRLAARGIEVRWAASADDSVKDGDVKRVPMATWNYSERIWGIPYPLWGPLSILRLIDEVRRCDIVHIHDAFYMGNLLAAWCALSFHKPLLVTQHIGLPPFRSWLPRALISLCMGLFTRPTLRHADRVVFISERILNFFTRQVRFYRLPVFIANGLDQKLFHAVDVECRRQLRQDLSFRDARPVILFVGRFVEKKGLGLLRQLAIRLIEYDWVFVGHGPDDPRDWGLANVRCDGMIDHEQIAHYYQAADLLILPSKGEGFPLVVQEAMACGVPVLVSAETAQAMSGVADVVLHTDPRVESLVDSVRQAFESPTLLSAKAISAQHFAKEHWDWEACADRYCELFEDLAGPQANISVARSIVHKGIF